MKPLRVFVIQPFGAKHSELFWELINKVCKGSEGTFDAFRADKEMTDAGSRLQDRIDSYIKKSDICIADMTGVRNENVLLEVGAALTLNIPTILVANNKLPSDIAGNLYLNLDTSRLENQTEQNSFKKNLYKRLTEASSKLNERRGKQFMVFGYESRRSVDFYQYIERSQDSISILTTNLGFILHEKLQLKFGAGKSTVLRLIDKSLPNKPDNFKIRILALDPDSNFTNERASALNRNRQEFREHMRQDLNSLKEYIDTIEHPGSFQLNVYDDFPLQMTYFFDDYVVNSIVATGISSRECITYIHSLKDAGATQTYVRHFEHLWGKSRSYAVSKRGYEKRDKDIQLLITEKKKKTTSSNDTIMKISSKISK